MTDAFCDNCYTACSEEHAKARRPCEKCGNTHYNIPAGVTVPLNGDLTYSSYTSYYSTRRINLDAYLRAAIEMDEIRVTNITREDFERFVAAGEKMLELYELAQDESKEEDERAGLEFELPPRLEFPMRLPDMYMRFGQWEDAIRVYAACTTKRYMPLYEFNFLQLIVEAKENEACVKKVLEIVQGGERSQKEIKKQLKEFAPRAINWTLRFYKGLRREKAGNDYRIELAKIPK